MSAWFSASSAAVGSPWVYRIPFLTLYARSPASTLSPTCVSCTAAASAPGVSSGIEVSFVRGSCAATVIREAAPPAGTVGLVIGAVCP
jgi:hypothetical protein